MTPMGHTELAGGKQPGSESNPISTPIADATVWIYGVGYDMIVVDGEVDGCKTYGGIEHGSFNLIADGAQVRVRALRTSSGRWEIGVSQLAEGAKILPVMVSEGENNPSPVARIEGVRVVLFEQPLT